MADENYAYTYLLRHYTIQFAFQIFKKYLSL